MRLIFLGTGTSTGVPVIGCKCEVCTSDNPKNKRTRTSMFVETDSKRLLIDITPDFRYQALMNKIERVDAILITHSHADHVNGFDDIRQLNFSMNWKIIPVFVNQTSYWELQSRFDYVFRELPQLGGGKPMVDMRVVEDYDRFFVGDLEIDTFLCYHGRLKVNGYRIKDFTYITDVSFIPSRSVEIIKGSRVLVISALRYLPHATHFTVSEVLNFVKLVQPEVVYLTHMGHEIDHEEISEYLKGTNVFPAYDGLVVEI